jgi:Domain of unknown function (DUF4279)
METQVKESAEAALRVSSRERSASEIASFLGLKPSRSVERGAYKTTNGTDGYREESRWILDSTLDDGHSVEEHIEHLLKVVEDSRSRLQRLPEDCEIDIWCTVSSDSGFAGLSFDKDVIKRAAAVSVGLILSVYAR